jgi:methylmalonyl-CoA mutase N-terminal domain/subunit
MTALSGVPTSHDEWLAAYAVTPERDAEFVTLSGEPVRPLYTAADVRQGRGLPGQFPFTRGVYPEDAVRIALRTQQIIAYETGVTSTIDPLGGSYTVEALTDEMEAAAYDYFRRIDELGGMVEAVKQNFCQREIADASFELQQRIDAGDRIVVGVNGFTDGDDGQTPILRIDPALERKQVDRVRAVRGRRDSERVELALADLRAAADSPRNLMPLLVDAARVHATEGEIVHALQDVWGAYAETPVF